MARLFWKHRKHTRETAVKAIHEADGDQDLAIEIGKRMLREDPGSIIGALLINLAISLMVKLIIYFITKYVMNGGLAAIPSEYQATEPGFARWGDDDDN